jgi:hypothetical protein
MLFQRFTLDFLDPDGGIVPFAFVHQRESIMPRLRLDAEGRTYLNFLHTYNHNFFGHHSPFAAIFSGSAFTEECHTVGIAIDHERKCYLQR